MFVTNSHIALFAMSAYNQSSSRPCNCKIEKVLINFHCFYLGFSGPGKFTIINYIAAKDNISKKN